jgi:hypothetical protein
MQTHRNLLHNDARHNAEMRIQPDDRILLLASPSGSQALATLFSALLNGAAVCPFPVAETGIAGLGEWMRRHDITVYVSAASAFRHFLKTLRPEERFPRIRLVKVGAEVVLGSDLAAAAGHFPEDCAYYCTYSCAEAGNILQQRISRGDAISGRASSCLRGIGETRSGLRSDLRITPPLEPAATAPATWDATSRMEHCLTSADATTW